MKEGGKRLLKLQAEICHSFKAVISAADGINAISDGNKQNWTHLQPTMNLEAVAKLRNKKSGDVISCSQ